MELLDRLVQIASQPRHRLRTDHFSTHDGYDSSHLPRADPAQKRFPDQQAYLLRPTLKLADHLGQKVLLARPRNAQSQRPQPGDKIPLVVAVAIISRFRPAPVPLRGHVAVSLALRQ